MAGDYNLGRAQGEIRISYDGDGARRAQADMAATAAEAAALDAAMGRVNDEFDRNRQVTVASSEDIIRARGEVERLKRVYQDYQDEYVKGQKRVEEARERAKDVLADEASDIDDIRRAHENLNKAQDDTSRLQQRAASAFDDYQIKLTAVRQEVDRFNNAHKEAANGFRNMGREAERFGNVLEGLEEKLSGIARILGQAGLFSLFGGAAGGQLFASAAGGMHILVTAMAAVVEVANAFVGAIALIPAVVNAAVLGVGTLAVAFQGVGAAIGAMNDPAKFVEAIKDLSPAAQQAMLTLQSFTEAFRGVRYAVQESLFAPIVAEIQPLVMTWLPLLQESMKSIAGEFGQGFKQVFQYFQTPEAQSSFQVFTQNMVAGFQAARGAIQPLLSAWNTLAEVGSSLFPRLGNAVTDLATKFNAWIERTAASGQLAEYLNKALDAFANMGRIIRDVALGINNIFGVFESQGGSALETIANLAAKFRDWTDSLSGQTAIYNFFQLLRDASEAVRPALSLLGDSLAIIGRTLTELGIAVQPGVTAFFQSFKEALAGLAPYVIQAAPAINAFLAAFGQTLQQVVASVGPQLPALMEDLAQAFISIMAVLPPVVEVLADFLGHVTPEQVVLFLGLVGALKALAITIPIVRGAMVALNLVMAANPIGLVITLAGALAAAAYLIITNWDQVSTTFKNVWSSITSTVSSWGSQAYEWGRNLIVNLGKGIMEAASSSLDSVLNFVANMFPDHWLTQSPAKKGPLNRTSPNEMGASVVTNFAAGMTGASPAVAGAASEIAGQAGAIGGSSPSAGFGSQSFTSGGVAGNTNKDFMTGQSGFDQWVRFITEDLTAWNNIFRQAFGLVNSISNIVTSTVRAVANIWNGGDNPITRPGGLMGPPGLSQQSVWGIENKPIPGVAPDQYGKDLARYTGQQPNPQQDVPGVQERREGGAPSTPAGPSAPKPGDPGFVGPVATTTGQKPPGTQGSAPPTTQPGGGLSARQSEISNKIIAEGKKRGMTDDQIEAALGIAAGESNLGDNDVFNTSGGNASVGGVGGVYQQAPKYYGGKDNVMNPDIAIPAFFDKYQDMLGNVSDPLSAAIRVQNPQLGADNLGSQYADQMRHAMTLGPYQAATAALAQGTPAGAGQAPSGTLIEALTSGNRFDASKLPEGMASPQGLHPNAELANRAITAIFGDRIRAQGATIGGNRDNDSGSGEHQGGALDIGVRPIDGSMPTEEQLALGKEIEAFVQQNAEAFGLQWSIYNNLITNAGGSPEDYGKPGQSTQGHYDHVHAFFGDPNVAGSGTGASGLFNLPPGFKLPTPASPQQAINAGGIPQLPAGPRNDFNTGLELPGAVRTGIQVGAAGLGAYGIARIIGSARESIAQSNFRLYDALAKQDIIRGLSPDEIARAGLTNPDQITFGEPGQGSSSRGFAVDASGPRPAPQSIPQTNLNGQQLPGGTSRGATALGAQRLAELNALSEQRIAQIRARGGTVDGALAGLTEPEMREIARIIQADPDVLNQVDPANAPKPVATSTGDAGARAPAANPWEWRNPPNRFGTATAPVTEPTTAPTARSGPGAIRSGLGAAGRVAGPALSGANALLMGWGFTAGAVDLSTQRSIEQGESRVERGSFVGIPVQERIPTPDSGSASRDMTPEDWAELEARRDRDAARGRGIQDQGPQPNAQRERRGRAPLQLGRTATSGLSTPGSVSRDVALQSDEQKIPKPGEPGFIGPFVQPDQGPQPGAERQRQGVTAAGTRATQGLLPPDPNAPARQFDVPNTDTRTPIDKYTSAMSSVSSVAGSAFQVFQDVIASIGATANIAKTLTRGFENTEDIVNVIQNIQQYIKTGASIAKLVGDVGGLVSAGGSGDPTGGAGAIGGAISAVAGIVQAVFEATNAAITIGIDIYHQVGKYAGFLFGGFLGGPNTGPLGGNVRMLLNTRTNELQTYSEDNPLNKNTFAVKPWMQSYRQTPNAPQGGLPPTVNIFTGPNQTPRDMMNESMWLISTGAPAVASVAGAE